MSTEIKKITGRYEVIGSSNTFEPAYKDSELYITRFFGGHKLGEMIQLTISGDNTSYVQLSKKQVEELVDVLKNSLDHRIYPSK